MDLRRLFWTQERLIQIHRLLIYMTQTISLPP